MTQGQNNYVKDIENKDNLEDQNLRDIPGIDKFNFPEFDKKIEQSFQYFVEETAEQYKNQAKKDILQPAFNAWLDAQMSTLDAFKDDEIAQNIIGPTSFELQGFQTLLDLEIFQEQIAANKDKTQKSVTLKLWDNEISLSFYNWITSQSVVKEINGSNFKDKEKIIDFLKKKEITKLQEHIWWEATNNNKLENLPIHWADWLFWIETFKALKKWINDKKITAPATASNTTTASNTLNQNPSAINWTSSWGWLDGQNTTNNVKPIDNNIDVADVGTDKYGRTFLYTCSLNDKIDLGTLPPKHTYEIIPPYDKGNSPLTLLDEKLQYEWKFPGQDIFTVILKDENWQEYRKNITINITSNEGWGININKYESVISKVEKEIKDIENNGNKKGDIEKRIQEIKTEYKDNLKEIKNTGNTEERIQDLSNRNNEIEAITKALILKEAEIHMKEYLNKDWETLKSKLNDNCDYYFGGEYISQEKFMNRLKSKNKNKKINLSDTRFVSFDVDLDNYDSIDQYLIDEKSDKRNFTIKDLILTDDKDLGKGNGLTKNQEIQYKAERYVWTESWKDIKREKRALKRILWLKGLKWVDEDMSIATTDYSTNNPALLERRNLRKLKKILWDAFKDEDVSVQEIFQNVSRDYDLSIPPRPSQGKNKKRQEFYELYKMYKEDKNCWDYFKKVMWLLENYFLRGIDGFDVVDEDENEKKDVDSLFTSIYKQEAIGRAKDIGLIDSDKRWQAVRQLFKERANKKWGIDLGVGFADSKDLRELKRIVNKIDLSTYLTDPNSTKKHKKFTELYNLYKENQKKDIKDEQGHFVVKWEKDSSSAEDLYYNAVFDFLVGVLEWRQDIVSAVNSMKIMDNLDGVEYDKDKEKDRYDNVNEKKFVMLLGDYNKDGRVDSGDRWTIMWLTVKNVYKSVNVDRNFSGDKDKVKAPWQNLIDFCENLMEQNGESALLSDVKELKKQWLEEILEELKTNPWLLNYLQTTLANSPMPIDYIFRYWENAQEEYLNYVLPQIESGEIWIEWLEKAFADQYNKLLKEWLVDDPEIRARLKPMFYAGVLNNGGISASVWTGLTYDAGKAGQFTMSLGVWNLAKDKEPVLGVVFSYNNSVELWKNTSFNFGWWFGTTNKTLFLPMFYGTAWITSRLNPNVDLKSLEAKSAHYFSTGGNITWIPWVWLGGWAYLWRSRDKMKLVDEQSLKIKEALTGENGVLYSSLVWVDLSKDKENVVSAIKQNLAKHFYKAKNLNDLNKNESKLVSDAAENLYRWVSYYSAWLENLKKDDPRLTAIIHEVAEAYAIQWKNNKKLDASSRHLSGAGVSVQMLAGFIPIISFVDFTKYKNLYSKETKQSHANYFEKLVTGRWMSEVNGEGFYIDWYLAENAVNYLNAKLGIAHPDVLAPDLEIKLKLTTENAGGDAVNVLHIPLDLIKYANINIDSNVANYSRLSADEKYLLVPANTKIWLMDYSRINGGKFHLFIWDNKAKIDDIQVGYDMQDYQWDPTKYEWALDMKIVVEKGNIDEKINKLKNNVENAWYQNNHPFPIKECSKIEDGKAVFELEKDMWQNCLDVGGKNSLIEIEWDSLTMPQTGTLTIVKGNDDKYNFYYRSDPTASLVLDYQLDSNIINTTETITKTKETIDGNEYDKTTTVFLDIFEEYDEIDKLFDDIEKELSKMDDIVPNIYGAFMASTFNLINDTIHEENYDKAFDKLKEILVIDNNNMFNELKSKIEDTNISDIEKVMIVDRFKAIFSYHPTISEGGTNTDNGSYLELINKQRDNSSSLIYQKLYWYDKTTQFPLKWKEYREDMVNDLKWNKTLERREEKNLFGMTAFYHRDNKKWKWYSMTQMWSTNVLWIKDDPNSWIQTIKKVDLEATKERFLNNLDKSDIHKKILKETLKKTLEEQTNIAHLDLDDDQLKQLLSWEVVDIWDKKVKLELDYVFYLLWECANESIGINLKGIEIWTKTSEEETSEEETDEISENWHRRVVVEGEKDYKSNLTTNSVVARTEIDYAKQKKFSVAWSYTVGPKPIPEQEDNPWSSPNSGDSSSSDVNSGDGSSSDVKPGDNSNSVGGENGDGGEFGGNEWV